MVILTLDVGFGVALVVVLSDPLQTLVDSACLGRQSTVQLAALGPNTAVFNSVFQLFAFLGVATANTVSSNSLQKGDLDDTERQTRRSAAEAMASTALVLALVLGVTATLVLLVLGPTWLQMMGTDIRVVPYAQEYMSIRALGTPFVLIMNVCQGVCLGQQDTVTPMLVCGLATLGNILGDALLIWVFGMGIRGAAIATTVAQTLATCLIIWRVKAKATKRKDCVDVGFKVCRLFTWTHVAICSITLTMKYFTSRVFQVAER